MTINMSEYWPQPTENQALIKHFDSDTVDKHVHKREGRYDLIEYVDSTGRWIDTWNLSITDEGEVLEIGDQQPGRWTKFHKHNPIWWGDWDMEVGYTEGRESYYGIGPLTGPPPEPKHWGYQTVTLLEGPHDYTVYWNTSPLGIHSVIHIRCYQINAPSFHYGVRDYWLAKEIGFVRIKGVTFKHDKVSEFEENLTRYCWVDETHGSIWRCP